MKKKKLEVYAIPVEDVKCWITEGEFYGKLGEARLTDSGIQFTFCLTKKSQEAQPVELAELRKKLETVTSALFDRARKGEITSLEAVELVQKEIDSSGIKVVTLDEDYVFAFIYKMRFPSFCGSFFKPEAWVGPGVGRKITKVELTNDGIEFTMLEVKIP